MKILDKETSSKTSTITDKIQEKIVVMQNEIDALSVLVDENNETLKSRLSEIETSLSTLSNEISAKDTPINKVTSDLASLVESIAELVATDELKANTILGTYAEIGEVHFDKTYANTSELGEAVATSLTTPKATVTELIATTLEIASFTIASLETTDFTTETLTASTGTIASLSSTSATLTKIQSERLSNVTWRTPTGTPDNTHLLRVSIAPYNGTFTMTTEQDEFSITVIENNLVSFSQLKNYLFRVDWNEQTDAIELYFANVGDTFSYALLPVGEDAELEVSSELVLRSSYEQNITVENGTGLYMRTEPITNKDSRVQVVVVANYDDLEETGTKDTIYVVKNDRSYFWSESDLAYIPMSKQISFGTVDLTYNDLLGEKITATGVKKALLSDAQGNSVTLLEADTAKAVDDKQNTAINTVNDNLTALSSTVTQEIADREAADTTLQNNITNEATTRETKDTELDTRLQNVEAVIPDGASASDKLARESEVTAITEKIPTQATSENQLADKDFVNSSIATNTANFLGTYTSEEDFPTESVTNNDYVFLVTTDEEGNTLYKRYKYNGTAWVFEYTLNNSSFTAAQWTAIQSGITDALVSKLNGIAEGAEVNVQSDWNETDETSDAYIQNKPTGLTVVDAVEDGNMNAVTSNAVNDSLAEYAKKHIINSGIAPNATVSIDTDTTALLIDTWNSGQKTVSLCTLMPMTNNGTWYLGTSAEYITIANRVLTNTTSVYLTIMQIK